MNPILEHLKALMETGTEADVRAFIAQHLTELPEALQKTIAVEMLKESLAEEAATNDAVLAEKRRAVQIIEALTKLDQGNSAA